MSISIELDSSDIMAVAELAEIRRTLEVIEERQKAVRAAIMAKLDAAGAAVGTISGDKVVSIVESVRPVISAKKVMVEFPEVWEILGTETEFRSLRVNAPSATT